MTALQTIAFDFDDQDQLYLDCIEDAFHSDYNYHFFHTAEVGSMRAYEVDEIHSNLQPHIETGDIEGLREFYDDLPDNTPIFVFTYIEDVCEYLEQEAQRTGA